MREIGSGDATVVAATAVVPLPEPRSEEVEVDCGGAVGAVGGGAVGGGGAVAAGVGFEGGCGVAGVSEDAGEDAGAGGCADTVFDATSDGPLGDAAGIADAFDAALNEVARCAISAISWMSPEVSAAPCSQIATASSVFSMACNAEPLSIMARAHAASIASAALASAIALRLRSSCAWAAPRLQSARQRSTSVRAPPPSSAAEYNRAAFEKSEARKAAWADANIYFW